MAAPPGYLRSMVGLPFGAGCRADRFCFSCQRGVCDHCCGDHPATHHPGDPAVRYSEVRMMSRGYGPCVEYHKAKGCKYSLDGIKRVDLGSGSLYLPLHRRQAALLGNPAGKDCQGCNDTLKTNQYTICSFDCKLVGEVPQHPVGDVPLGLERAQALVAFDFQALHARDRFCSECHHFYSSALCHAHLQFHHPGNADAYILRIYTGGGAGRVLTLVDHLPDHVAYGLQMYTIAHPEGQMIGVQVVPQHPPSHPEGAEPGAGQVQCAHQGCPAIIGEQAIWCSIRCKGLHLGWWRGMV